MEDSGPRSVFTRSVFTRRLTTGRLYALDALAAVGLTVAVPAGHGTGMVTGTGAGVPGWALWLIAAGTGAPVAVRRRWPVPVFCVVLMASVTAEVLGTTRTLFAAVALALALYTVALTQPRRRWLPTPVIAGVAAAGVFGLSATGSSRTGPVDTGEILSVAAVLSAAWTAGRAVRERRAFAARAAEQRTERAVAEERLRIARELHDVVTHSMGLIAIKAGIANHVAGERPQEAMDALRVIEATSRGALTDMRRMLGVLRYEPEAGAGRGAGTGAGAEPELSPAPGLSGLPELVERAGAAGVHATLRVEGPDGLPEGVGLSVYRIVQEALTNVVKHAPSARCRITVETGGAGAEGGEGGEVRIEVTDDGGGGAGPRVPGGHGLIGMRERVALYGGTLTAGPRPGGGFRVAARLPYRPAPPATPPPTTPLPGPGAGATRPRS
ncbi:sensor histidine kinase [Streptomyces sp. JV176]|uniref:sensor histidine kinase n=1 Tax=Streptomyces sp. JV176 TaxID=858630 RepID=UPI002E76067B|nr:sensor histidine kinase [Streptomyces sp. JV176]MEE1802747.1 sensor histidine kinase [Streptomyces sp. JV176]